MKSLKKTLSLVLVFVMAFGLMISASAFTDDADVQYTEAVNVMTGIGAIAGFPDGSFQPDGLVTRAQAAKMIAYSVLGPSVAANLKATGAIFNDFGAGFWGAPYIEYCYTKGIVNGRAPGKFDPNGNVTTYELAKMILAAAGYGKNGEYVGASWIINVAVDASNKGVFEGLEDDDYSNAATREEAALLIFNGITSIKRVTYSKDEDKYTEGAKTIAEEVFKYASGVVGIVTGSAKSNGKTILTVDDTNVNDATAVAGLVYTPDFDLYGKVVKVFYNTSTKAVYYLEVVSTSVTAKASMTAKTFEEAVGKSTEWATAATIAQFDNYTYDDDGFDSSTAIGTYDPTVDGTIFTVYDDEVVAVVNPLTFTIDQVTDIDTTAGSESITFQTIAEQENNADSDTVVEYAGIEEDDYVSATLILGKYYLDKATEVQGKITKVDGTSYYVDGIKYSKSAINETPAIVDAGTDFKNTFKFYLDKAGKWFGIEKVTDEAVASNVFYVATEYSVTSTDEFGADTTKWYVQTVGLDGVQTSYLIKIGAGAPGTAAGLYTAKLTDTKKGIYTLTGVDNMGAAFPADPVKLADDTIATDLVFGAKDTTITAAALNTSAVKGYLTANTKYLFVDGTLADLTAEVVTGGVNYTYDVDTIDSFVLLSKDADGNVIVNAVVILDEYADEGIEASDYLFALRNVAPAQNADGYEYTVYAGATGQKMTITASNATVAATGFYKYVLVDGVYTLTVDATLEQYTFTSKFGTQITADAATEDLVDADAANAVIVDVDATKDETAVTSLSQFKATTKFFALTNADGDVTVIFVTDRK